MTDTLALPADDLFDITQSLKARVRASTVDYNRLTQAEKHAADALIDESQVRISILDGRKVLKPQSAWFVGVQRLLTGGFL